MKPALFYKLATTGLPLFAEPSEDPRQPHMVQLAAVLMDLDTRQMIGCLDTIVRPDDWQIPEESTELRGIPHVIAARLGIGEPVALNTLLDLWSCAEVRIGHGQAFDARIVRIAMKRHLVPAMGQEGEQFADQWKDAPAICTAKLVKELRGLTKQPTLEDAFAMLVGAGGAKLEAKNVNDALQACIAVYFAAMDEQAAQKQAA